MPARDPRILRNPSSVATDADWAWFAGLMEGEGSFGSVGQNTVMEITQKDPWPLIKVQAICGGRTYGKNARGHFRWSTSGNEARAIVRRIFPMLSPRRREQAMRHLGDKEPQTRTHCMRGHQMVEGNLYFSKTPSGRIARQCRTCALDRAQKKRATR